MSGERNGEDPPGKASANDEAAGGPGPGDPDPPRTRVTPFPGPFLAQRRARGRRSPAAQRHKGLETGPGGREGAP